MNKEELHQLLHPMKVIGLGGNPALNEKIAAILHKPWLYHTWHIHVQIPRLVHVNQLPLS